MPPCRGTLDKTAARAGADGSQIADNNAASAAAALFRRKDGNRPSSRTLQIFIAYNFLVFNGFG